MMRALKKLGKTTLKEFGVGITSYGNLQLLMESKNDITSLVNLPREKLSKLLKLAENTKSQLKQDLFVLSELDFKRNGFFVEFGATNGVDLSNSYLLEKEFNWNGILAEPAKCWHSDLRKNRSSNIETNCVWRDSKSVLAFNEVDVAELSTISTYSTSDLHGHTRKSGHTYSVNTISLIDLLDKYNAPNQVDYLSIDTEGSEYEILRNFDFNKYQFSVITCEHNFTPMREKIYELLTNNGYTRKYAGFSNWDDWYIRSK